MAVGRFALKRLHQPVLFPSTYTPLSIPYIPFCSIPPSSYLRRSHLLLLLYNHHTWNCQWRLTAAFCCVSPQIALWGPPWSCCESPCLAAGPLAEAPSVWGGFYGPVMAPSYIPPTTQWEMSAVKVYEYVCSDLWVPLSQSPTKGFASARLNCTSTSKKICIHSRVHFIHREWYIYSVICKLCALYTHTVRTRSMIIA